MRHSALLFFALVLCAGQDAPPPAQAPPAPAARLAAGLIHEFQTKVEAYAVVHREAEKQVGPLKPGSTAAKIGRHQRELAKAIRRLRRNAAQGDIFTPRIAAEIRSLTGAAVSGPRGARVEKSLRRAEPVQFHVVVNRSYPSGTPLQSVPPTLLLYLPELQSELEYRIVGDTLILRDTAANLVVDFMRQAIPGV